MRGRLDRAMRASEALSRRQAVSTYRVGAARPAPEGATAMLLWLHGSGGDDRELVETFAAAPILDAAADALGLAELVAVMPDFGPTWYVDAAVKAETALREEILPAAEALVPAGARRVVGGLSMGGFGALRLGLALPERFDAIVALAPALAWTPSAHSALRRVDVFGDPFDEGRWRAHHPARLLRTGGRVDPSCLPPIYLAVGDADEYALAEPVRRFYRDVAASDRETRLREVVGGRHDESTWWPGLAEGLRFALGGQPQAGRA